MILKQNKSHYHYGDSILFFHFLVRKKKNLEVSLNRCFIENALVVNVKLISIRITKNISNKTIFGKKKIRSKKLSRLAIRYTLGSWTNEQRIT